MTASTRSLLPAPRELPMLPPEILQLVVESVLPANTHTLLTTSHSAARTLLALTRVSRVTYRLASRLLRQRCLYIETSRRLGKVLLCMDRHVPSLPPPSLSLRNITSLYLSPFETTLDDQPTAMWVRQLFCEVSQTLRRLVVHMPFRSLDLPDDHLNVRPILREGFEQLVHLEEFVCLGEYPTLSTTKASTDVWRLWPELKRLVLFEVPVDNHWLWWNVATLSRLEHVVLANPMHLEGTNIKDEYFHKLPPDCPELQRHIRIVLYGVAYAIPTEAVDTARWNDIDPKERMTVERYEVPLPFYGDETPSELVTGWIRRGALDGTLWKWQGEKLGPARRKGDSM